MIPGPWRLHAGGNARHPLVGGPPEVVAGAVERFTELTEAHRDDPGRLNPGADPSIGATVRVILDRDENLARERGRLAWKHFDANITKLWRAFGVTELPNSPSAGGDFDLALSIDMAFAGTPAMLVDFIGQRAELGIDPLLLGLEWGDLESTEVRRSLDLFVEDVMPATVGF